MTFDQLIRDFSPVFRLVTGTGGGPVLIAAVVIDDVGL